ncbi:MAG: hypothetical protein AAFQ29_06225 [Pseudomonadota bacterium]
MASSAKGGYILAVEKSSDPSFKSFELIVCSQSENNAVNVAERQNGRQYQYKIIRSATESEIERYALDEDECTAFD